MSTIPDQYMCPITRQVMLDPAKLEPCGHIYSSVAIHKWMEREKSIGQIPICPLDRRPITRITPLKDLQAKIHQFINENPALFENKDSWALQRESLLEEAENIASLESNEAEIRLLIHFLYTVNHPANRTTILEKKGYHNGRRVREFIGTPLNQIQGTTPGPHYRWIVVPATPAQPSFRFWPPRLAYLQEVDAMFNYSTFPSESLDTVKAGFKPISAPVTLDTPPHLFLVDLIITLNKQIICFLIAYAVVYCLKMTCDFYLGHNRTEARPIGRPEL